MSAFMARAGVRWSVSYIMPHSVTGWQHGVRAYAAANTTQYDLYRWYVALVVIRADSMPSKG